MMAERWDTLNLMLYDVIHYKQCVTPTSITKEGLYLPEPTEVNSPVAFNMNFDWTKLQPWSAFSLDPSLCRESLPVTLHTRLDLRHLIPKLTWCSGQIVMWIFSGVWKQWKQALRARISSISVSKPLNWSCFLWLDIFFEHQIPMVRFYVIQSLILDQLLIHHQPRVRRYMPLLNIVSRRLRLMINLALFYFLEKFMVKIIFSERLVNWKNDNSIHAVNTPK